MSSDSKVHGEIYIDPPLKWGQIRTFMGGNPKAPTRLSESLRLAITENTEDTDDGTIVTKTCDTIYPASMDSAWGVTEALALLGSVSKTHTYNGHFTIVDEYPEFDPRYVEAKRFTVINGRLVKADAVVTYRGWEEVK